MKLHTVLCSLVVALATPFAMNAHAQATAAEATAMVKKRGCFF
jgi:hypothetical protein